MFFGRLACRILVPQPGIEPMPPAVEARSPNHWATREVPDQVFSNHFIKRVLLKQNLMCMGAPCTATTYQSVFILWPKDSSKRAELIISLPLAHSSKTSHQAWSKMPSPCRLWAMWPCPPPQLISHLPGLALVGSPVTCSPPHLKDLTKDALSFASPSHLPN